MQRSDFIKVGWVLVLGLAACGPARPEVGGAGGTQPVAGATSAGIVATPVVGTPGVLTALPGLPTATPWSSPLLSTPLAGSPQPSSNPGPAENVASQPAAPVTPIATRITSPGQPPTQPAPALPTPTLACQDGLRYLSDLTIPDGTLVAPNDLIDKRWQVENSGSCNWNENYRLRRISGEALGVPGELALYPARSGAQAVIRIVFTAPVEPGTYRSAWQAYNPQGEAFGDPVFVEIIVGAGSP